jgi:hypothetical protein
MVMKRPKGQKQPELGINTTETNEQGDMQTNAIFGGLLLVAFGIFGAAAFWSWHNASTALSHQPIQWVAVVLPVLFLAGMVLVTRSLIWASFFASIMFATKTKAWRSQENLSRLAIKAGPVIPGAASTAALVLAQNLLGQSKIDEAIAVAEEQWQRSGSKASADQNLAQLCSTVGLAYQLRGSMRESIAWNDRAITAFQGVLDQMANPKGFVAKLAASQGTQWIGPLKMHVAAVHMHNASAHMSQMNYRQAKENFKKAVDYANQAPDSAEKTEILRVAREQLGRLKHA